MARTSAVEMSTNAARTRGIPAWLRWAALFWLAVWIPGYWRTWGAANFLHLCDVAVFLTCAGLWSSNSLLLSSQALSSIVVDTAWLLDAAWRLLFAKHLIGGTEYLWDARFPLWARLLSLFHVILPALLVWSLTRVGYKRHGLRLQSAIAAVLLVASRFVPAARNINFAWTDPILHRSLGPAAFHLAVIYVVLIGAIYWPTHLALVRWIHAPAKPV
jgi:hypothetical protein